ncbi:MAG: flagellar basal-body MS-ring/collar protein FliF [Hyphomicrobiaceae bacterium]
MIARKQLEELGANLMRLGTRRLVVLGIIGLSIVVGVSAVAHVLSRPTMQSIYTNLTTQDVGRITAALAEAGVPFDVNEQRSAVLVPVGQGAKARALLAQKGLPSSARAGYELFDQMGSMGLTSFMQEVTRVRALEGEIARTIQALDGVAAARVHLVLPETTSLRRDRREPSASVLLRIEGRWQASAGQVVRHIVAAAVPSMKAEQVSVASTDGRLIASAGDEKTLSSLKLSEMESTMAAELEQRASRTLASALGAGNFQVSVTVRLDVDRQQINETVYDPKSRIERSVRVVRQTGSSEDGGSKTAVGVETNLPRPEASPAESEKRRQREDRREELINYELNSKAVQTVREGYRVQRLAVAVVVNRKQLTAKAADGAEPADIATRLADLKRLIAAATGAESTGSSSIEISVSDLATPGGALAPAASTSLSDQLIMNLGTIINAVVLLAVVIAVLLLGLRPLMTVLGRASETTAIDTAKGGAMAGLPVGGMATAPMLEANMAPSALGAIADARPGAAAKPQDALLRERLETLVAADEVKVASVLKTWMAEAKQS